MEPDFCFIMWGKTNMQSSMGARTLISAMRPQRLTLVSATLVWRMMAALLMRTSILP